MSEPLDQDRPLWQIYLIESLNGKRFAAVSKTHHALVDGIAAVDVGAVILDPDPKGTDLGLPSEPWTPNTARTDQMLLQRVVGARERFLGLSRETASRMTPYGAASTTMEAGRTARGFLELARNSDPVKPTFLNEEIGRDRRVAFGRTSLEAVKAGRAGAAARPSTTSILSVSTGALRRYFELRGEPVPSEFVGARPDEHPHARGEGRARQPDDDAARAAAARRARRPRARLEIIRDTTAKLKASEGARAASLIIEASGWVPPTVNRLLGQMNAALAPVTGVMPQRLPWNLVISNVPGPPMPVYLLGRRLQAIHPFVALSPQKRALSIGVISYDGDMMFGLVGDRDRLPDLDRMSDFLDAALEEQYAVV